MSDRKVNRVPASQIAENEFRINVLEQMFNWIRKNNPDLKMPSPDEMQKMERQVAAHLNKKYPSISPDNAPSSSDGS